MKNILIKLTFIYISSICLVFASNGTSGSGGGSKGMSWEEILVSTQFKVDFPTYDIEKYSIYYNELCLAPNDMIRTKKQYLIGWNEVGDSRIYLYDYLTRPREINKKVCMDLLDGECVWEDLVVDSIPLEQPIEIFYYDSDDQKWKLDDKRNYQIDSCEADRSIMI